MDMDKIRMPLIILVLSLPVAIYARLVLHTRTSDFDKLVFSGKGSSGVSQVTSGSTETSSFDDFVKSTGGTSRFDQKTSYTGCNNTVLRNTTNSVCQCLQTSAINCVLQHCNDMNTVLQEIVYLRYIKIKQLQFYVNQTFQNNSFSIPKLDLRLLEHFTELQHLRILPITYRQEAIHLVFNASTFQGCNKITELQINVLLNELKTDSLHRITRPLQNLSVLDFNYVRGISYKSMKKVAHSLTHKIEKLRLSSFQVIGQIGYDFRFRTTDFLPGRFQNLVEIDLSNNGFANVYTGLYNIAPNLRFLDVSENEITHCTNVPFFVEALMHPNIEILNISSQGNNHQSKETSSKFVLNPSSQYSNHLHHLNSQVYASSKSSNFVGSSENRTGCLNDLTNGNISTLFANHSSVFCKYIQTCVGFWAWNKLSCEPFPPFYEMFDPDCDNWLKLPLGRSMREIYFSNNNFDMSFNSKAVINKLCFTPNQLQKLEFSNNYNWANVVHMGKILNGITKIDGLESLSEFVLDNNQVETIFTNQSWNLPNLTVFRFSENFAGIALNMSLCRDKGFYKLRKLDFSQNNLSRQVPLQIVEDCKYLNNLSLARNGLNSSFFISLSGASVLSFIDLSVNNIETLSPRFTSELDKIGNLTVNISNNPLLCGCSKEALSFIKWVTGPSRKTKLLEFDKLLCAGTSGQRSLKSVVYSKLRNECLSIIPIAATIASSLTLVCLILSTYFIYRKRFVLLYHIFKFKRCIKENVFSKQNSDHNERCVYTHDAFVSYSSDDRFWVHDVLVKTLEKTYGFKLFIHYRDILLGQKVMHEIHKNVQKSREYIIVLSENYLSSEWCQIEMEEAYRESLRRRKYLAIIVLGNVPTQISRNPTASKILDQHNYLQWMLQDNGERDVDSSKGRKLFWAKLVQFLHGSKSSFCCCCCEFGVRATTYRDIQAFAGDDAENPDVLGDSVENSRRSIQ